MARDVKGALAKLLELPESTLSKGCYIEIYGNREILVEGCRNILEYSDETIRLSMPDMVLRFTGKNLLISTMDKNAVIVRGEIAGIEFLN